MTIDHLPRDPFEKFTWQSLGFISAAEGFIFLSGLVAGLVYGRMAISQGMAATTRRIWRRALTIYFSNAVLIIAGIIAAKAGIAVLGDGVQPSWSLCLKALLCVEPAGYAEILRMYFVLFLILPLVFWALIKNQFAYVIVISCGLWFASSRGYGMVAFPQLGYFDIASWQMLFMAGIYFGFTTIKQGKEFKIPDIYTTISLPVTIAFLFLRHWQFLTGHFWSPYFAWLFTWRRTLSFARLVNFAAFTTVVYRFRNRLASFMDTALGSAVTYLGQHSLQVFMWSVFISMVMAKVDHRWSVASSLDQAMVTILIVASCFIPAWLHQQWKMLRREMLGYRLISRPTIP